MRAPVTLAAALAFAAGCLSPQDMPTSSIEIPLQQTGSDGNLYHLNGAFTIAAGDGSTIHVPAGSNAAQVVVPHVPPGIAMISLDAGWSLLESTDSGTTYATVDAIVSSPNPNVVRVLANQPTSMEMQFIVRKPNGTLTISLGVDPAPRELAGGVIADMGTLDYAPYTNARFDFAIYFDVPPTRTITADGLKQLTFDSTANNAMEAFNDTNGLFVNTVAPAMAGGDLHYTVTAQADGTTVVQGSYSGANSPGSTLQFGPHTVDPAVPVDADGYPTDEFFYDPFVPFTLDTFFDDGDATLDGQLRLRFIPPA
jgi:hypothetical protein